jgi:hypothetical protein
MRLNLRKKEEGETNEANKCPMTGASFIERNYSKIHNQMNKTFNEEAAIFNHDLLTKFE